MQSLPPPFKPAAPPRAALVWLRRDLRIEDNSALAAALGEGLAVHIAFVFDKNLLGPLPRADRRVTYIHASVVALDQRVRQLGGRPQAGLICRHDDPVTAIVQLASDLNVEAVYASHDDEPYALARDAQVRSRLSLARIAFHSCKDHVVCERSEVLTRTGQPYSVFTPYKRAWLEKVQTHDLAARESVPAANQIADRPPRWSQPPPTLQALGFDPVPLSGLALQPGEQGAQAALADFLPRLGAYADARDFPDRRGTSELSVHLRFGTLSVRQAARHAWLGARANEAGASTWLSELIWRDFYAQVLHHHPHVVGHAFKPALDTIQWETGPQADALFSAWCEGRTGYPLVDAAMRHLVRSGAMHNRLRMVTASFLVKDLGIDWRLGEAFFAQHLNDFDLASNNGGWQWAASTGCDAQPWFRIFNPITQSEKFDPTGNFIRGHLPELAALPNACLHAPWRAAPIELASGAVRLGVDYPLPVVDHEQARQRTLARFGVVKAEAQGAA